MSMADMFKEKLFFDAFHNAFTLQYIAIGWFIFKLQDNIFKKVGPMPSFLSHTLRSKIQNLGLLSIEMKF